MAGQGGEGGKVQCLWSGCKVYGALSSSTTWLTSHVTGHIGSKPFRCIVDACRQRFASQVSKSGTKFKTFAKGQCCGSGSGIGKKSGSGSGIRIRELRNHFLGVKIHKSLVRIRDPGWKKFKKFGSGINLPVSTFR